MFGARIGDDADGRRGKGGERGELPGVVGAHLDDRVALVVFESQQRQRQADVVVEVAAGGERGGELAQDRGDHLLAGGLAVAACDADDRAGVARAACGRRTLQGDERIRDQDHRQPGGTCALSHGPGGACGRCGTEEICAVEVRAA